MRSILRDEINKTTRLFLFGGMMEVQNPGGSQTVTKYYSLAGMKHGEYMGKADFLTALEETLAGVKPVDDKFMVINPGETLTQDRFR